MARPMKFLQAACFAFAGLAFLIADLLPAAIVTLAGAAILALVAMRENGRR